MIRLLLAALSLLLFTVISLLSIPIAWIVGLFSERARDLGRMKLVKGYLRVLMLLCGAKVTVIGRERIPKDTPALYTPNHQGMFDIVSTLAYGPDRNAFISKKEWEKVPLLSWWITWIHGLYLDREDLRSALKTILAAIDLAKEGSSVTIFPEGTRNKGEDKTRLLPFHEGSFKIATKARIPIVPVAITHTADVLERQFPRIRGARITLEYLDPVYPDQLTGDERKFIGKYVQGLIQEALVRNN